MLLVYQVYSVCDVTVYIHRQLPCGVAEANYRQSPHPPSPFLPLPPEFTVVPAAVLQVLIKRPHPPLPPPATSTRVHGRAGCCVAGSHQATRENVIRFRRQAHVCQGHQEVIIALLDRRQSLLNTKKYAFLPKFTQRCVCNQLFIMTSDCARAPFDRLVPKHCAITASFMAAK